MSTPRHVTDAAGRRWFPYAVEFASQEGAFIVTIWATSDYHAVLQLEDLKATARLRGQIVHQSPAEPRLPPPPMP